MTTASKPDNLTARQADVWVFIADYTRETGRPPTLRQIAQRFQIVSTNGVVAHLGVLQRKGYLRRDERQACGIRLLRWPDDARNLSVPVKLLRRWDVVLSDALDNYPKWLGHELVATVRKELREVLGA